jgi:hypothetical protein
VRVSKAAAQATGLSVGAAVLALGLMFGALTENSTGSVTFVAVGVLLLGTTVFSDRIQSLEFGGAKLTLHQLARERSALAIQSERRGDDAQALKLRKQARALQRLAGAYARTRQTMKASNERTRAMEQIMGQARGLARDADFSPVEVWTWFDSGQTEARAIALGLMEGDPELRDVHCVLEAIERPRNLFEQFHALRLADEMFPKLEEIERTWLREAVVLARKSDRARSDAEVDSLTRGLLARLG